MPDSLDTVVTVLLVGRFGVDPSTPLHDASHPSHAAAVTLHAVATDYAYARRAATRAVDKLDAAVTELRADIDDHAAGQRLLTSGYAAGLGDALTVIGAVGHLAELQRQVAVHAGAYTRALRPCEHGRRRPCAFEWSRAPLTLSPPWCARCAQRFDEFAAASVGRVRQPRRRTSTEAAVTATLHGRASAALDDAQSFAVARYAVDIAYC